MSASSQTDGSDVVNELFNTIKRSLRNAVIVKIESYNAAERSADVTLLVQEERKIDGEFIPVPASRQSGCPVVFNGGQAGSLVIGLKTGDHCLALYRHRSHDEIDNGDDGPLIPASGRRFNDSDLIVLGSFVAPGKGLDSSQYREDGQPVLALPELSSIHIGDSNAGYFLVREDLFRNYIRDLHRFVLVHKHPYPDGTTSSPTNPTVSVPPIQLDFFPPDMHSDAIKVSK